MKGGVDMRKWLLFLVIVFAFFVFGCGPKGASQRTLDALSGAKVAAEAAEAKAKEREQERMKLEEEKKEKEARVKSLEQEVGTLKREEGEIEEPKEAWWEEGE